MLIEIAISAAVTAALIAISYFLGAWRSVSVDESSARDRIAFDEPDFHVGAILVGSDGKAAIALDEGRGEGALVFALGDGVATRRFKLGSLSATAEKSTLTIALRDVSKWRVRIDAASSAAAVEWARRVGASSLGSSNGVS